MSHAHYDEAAVEAWLDYPGCIKAVREAMARFSASQTPQPLRQIIPLEALKVLAVMPGFLSAEDGASVGAFGGKMISVVKTPANPGRSRHQGLVVVFDPETGALVCTADAEAVTTIRTAAASAVATDALARPDAKVMAVLGAGTQAKSHIEAIRHVRPLTEVRVWGRDADKTARFAEAVARDTGLNMHAVTDLTAATSGADIICTVTGAYDPFLSLAHIDPGTHLNVVGSSGPGPREVTHDLVAASRYIADSRRSVLAAGAEFLQAIEDGVIGEDHIAAEIGEVLNGTIPGRTSDDQITLYKSLGHVVQDLCAAVYIHRRAHAEAPRK